MKDLKEILLESVNYFDEIIDLTFNFVDYMYNEGVVAYDDELHFYEDCGFKKGDKLSPMFITSLWT